MQIRRDDAPLIVTALLDQDAFKILDALRRRYFPPSLNKVPAHLSLFHNLPGAELDRIRADAFEACAYRHGFNLASTGACFLGRGVALGYDAPGLRDLHADLAGRWANWLTPQDRQPFRPHVTIQNKVAPDDARLLFGHIKEQEFPTCRVEGVSIWRYRNGPWEPVEDVGFRRASQ